MIEICIVKAHFRSPSRIFKSVVISVPRRRDGQLKMPVRELYSSIRIENLSSRVILFFSLQRNQRRKTRFSVLLFMSSVDAAVIIPCCSSCWLGDTGDTAKRELISVCDKSCLSKQSVQFSFVWNNF